MKTKFIVLFFTLFISTVAFAQLEVKPDSFKKVEGFINVNNEKMYDDNNKPYSVLKIKTENINDKQRRELLFQGDAATFFEVEYMVGEVWLYISYYATYLKISHPDLSSTEFSFPFDMMPKCGYELTLVNVSKSEIDEEKILNMIDQRIESTSTDNSQVESKTEYKFLILNASINKYGDLSYGITFGQLDKIGWFASVMTNFDFQGFKTDYKCDSDFLVNGYYPVYTGKESFTSFSLIGGFIIRLAKPLSVRIGAGYGNRTVSYETLDNKWIENNSLSIQGIDTQLGFQCNLKGFIISADCVANNFMDFEAKIGLGYGF